MKSINKIILFTCSFLLAACSSTPVSSNTQAYKYTDFSITEKTSPLSNISTSTDNHVIEESTVAVENTPYSTFDPSTYYTDVDDYTYMSYLYSNFPSEVEYAMESLKDNHLCQQIQDKYLFFPISILVDEEYRRIRWCAADNAGMNSKILSNGDIEIYNHWKSIYYGDLIQLDNNKIYAAKGTFLPIMLSKSSASPSNTDFYIKIDNDKLYIILDDLSISDLIDYESENYYVKKS